MSDDLRQILEQVQTGAMAVDEGLRRLEARLARARQAEAIPKSSELGFATVDHDRARRCGFPEVIYCQGKSPEQTTAIAREILSRAPRVLLTRASADHARELCAAFPWAVRHEIARCITVDENPLEQEGLVAVLAAGTADLPVAEEAAVTSGIMGARVERHTDIGVAGLHRLLDRLEEIRACRCIVAVAGMEGALPSVVGGLVDVPVIAVPTSVGYGLSLEGLTPLLTMLNSCAAGVGVVNIDNGFGAGYLAALINRRGGEAVTQ